jgi:hypothetical protein
VTKSTPVDFHKIQNSKLYEYYFNEYRMKIMNDFGNMTLSEDNQRLKDRVFQIPPELYTELKNKYTAVKDNPNYTECKNYKRLQNIIESGGTITYKWMYTLVDWRDKYTGELEGMEQDRDAWLISADKLMKWVDETLKNATGTIRQSDETMSKIGAVAHSSTHFRTIK